jgi:hypothetical protein
MIIMRRTIVPSGRAENRVESASSSRIAAL